MKENEIRKWHGGVSASGSSVMAKYNENENEIS
jgi:hypothetical protein